MRLFLLLLLVVSVWRMFRRFKKAPPLSKDRKGVTSMVSCDVCSLHIPEKEAICVHDEKGQVLQYFCCEEHRKQKIP